MTDTYATIKKVEVEIMRQVIASGSETKLTIEALVPASAATATVATTVPSLIYGDRIVKATITYAVPKATEPVTYDTIVKSYKPADSATEFDVVDSGFSSVSFTIPANSGTGYTTTTSSTVTFAIKSGGKIVPSVINFNYPGWSENRLIKGCFTCASGGKAIDFGRKIIAVLNFETSAGFGVFDYKNQKMKVYSEAGTEKTSGTIDYTAVVVTAPN